MISIGLRNLKRDRLRMAIAISGVVFAVVLVTLELGLLFGLVQNASLLIDRSHADIWVMMVNVKTLDFGTPLSHRNKYRLQSVPGVDRVEEYNVTYSSWQLPEGGNANIQIVAFETHSQLAPLPTMVAGTLDDLHNSNGILIDCAERRKLGDVQIGDTVELLGAAGKVVGYTEGMRSFTTTPYIFTSLRRGEKYGWLNSAYAEPTAIYFLVRVAPGEEPGRICRMIEQQIPGVDALTRQEFSWRTRSYWLIETGMGMGFVIAASLGLLVGGIILSQSLYAMTLQKLPEFGVLKAMGASMSELARPVLEQGLVCGVLGLAIGLMLSFGLQYLAQEAGTTILISGTLLMTVAPMTLALCAGASCLSIVRLYRVDPVTVFQA